MAAIRGSGKEVGELPPVECTYPQCKRHFMTEKDMKRHKSNDPAHDYCKRCDVDCEDWEDMMQHKIKAMQPFLGRRKPGPDQLAMHIVCERCGEDFKSWGGRELHWQRSHPGQQTIHCSGREAGCDEIFTSAASLQAHLERGECSVITRYDFISNQQRKFIQAQLMESGDKFRIASAESKLPSIDDEASSVPDTPLSSARSTISDDEGGVSIMDQEDDGQHIGFQALQAQTQRKPSQYSHTSGEERVDPGEWPRRSGWIDPSLTESFRNVSIDLPTVQEAHGKSHRNGDKHVKPVGSTSTAITHRTATKPISGAWATGNASKALIKEALPTPPPGRRAAFQPDNVHFKDVEPPTEGSKNLLEVNFWDPASPDYDPDYFLHSVTQMYCCPFPNCGAEFDTQSEIVDHIHSSAHLNRKPRCPACLKIFSSTTALMAHCEATRKCRIKDSKHFSKFINQLSGGFLDAERLRKPAPSKHGEMSVEAGERIDGSESVVFTSKLPSNFSGW